MAVKVRSKYTWLPFFSASDEIFWLKAIVAIGFAFAFLMTINLWLNVRSYPLAPAIQGLPLIGHPFDILLFATLLLLLGCVFVAARPRPYIWAFLAILALLCLYDQNRWQPYIFMYAFLFAALGAYSWKSNDAAGKSRALNTARFIVASTYLYSGVQKMNPGFVHEVWPWLLSPLTHAYPSFAAPVLMLAYVAPLVQVGFGIGLLSKRFRKQALILAVLMHVFILAMIGPWALDWNTVVWPWTIAMVCFDLILFGGVDDFSYRDILSPGNSALHWIVLLLFGIMPIASFFNLWDSDLSAALYTGNLTQGYVHVSTIGKAELPASVQQYAISDGTNDYVLPIKSWALGDMNAIEYPETRVFKTIGASLCSQMSDPTQLILVIQEARLFRSGGLLEFRCNQL
ncbi:MAG: hypothetical protein P4L81_06740 [Candidatus Pacebacteria bacterium]|nr:hypothetical protein [Candidatus Paceibacterota bacterium]